MASSPPPGTPAPGEDDDEDAAHQTWILATTHPSAILRTPDEKDKRHGQAVAAASLPALKTTLPHEILPSRR